MSRDLSLVRPDRLCCLWIFGAFHLYFVICIVRVIQFRMGYLPAFDWPIINSGTIAWLLFGSIVIQQPLLCYIAIVELTLRRRKA